MLCGRFLRESVYERNVVIFPFHQAQLHTNGYDVTVGSIVYLANEGSADHEQKPFVMGKREAGQGSELWRGPMGCRTVSSLENQQNREACEASGLKESDQVIILNAGQTALVCTKEFVGCTVSDIAPVLVPRVTYERSNIHVRPAQGTPGFVNRWVLHVTNNNSRSVILVVGQPVAQVQFWRVDNVRGAPTYGSNPGRDKYHPYRGHLVDTVKNWRPEQMLPRYDTESFGSSPDKSEPVPSSWAPSPPQQPALPPPSPVVYPSGYPGPQGPQAPQGPYQGGTFHPSAPPGPPQARPQPIRGPNGELPLPPALQPIRVGAHSAPAIPMERLAYNPEMI